MKTDARASNHWSIEWMSRARLESARHWLKASSGIDETHVKIKAEWKYLYRAVDSTGQTIEFILSAKRDTRTAKRFFRKTPTVALRSSPDFIRLLNFT